MILGAAYKLFELLIRELFRQLSEEEQFNQLLFRNSIGYFLAKTLSKEQPIEGLTIEQIAIAMPCLLYTSPSPRDRS